MRVTLKLESGQSAGRRARLLADQSLRVGRLHWADFTVSEDSDLSGIHFAIVVDGRSCWLRDLRSQTGTRVNGQAIEEVELRHGDRITAGKTEFRLEIEEARTSIRVAASLA